MRDPADSPSALGAAGIGLWSWRVDEDAIQWNDQMVELFGLSRGTEPTDYAAYLQCVHPDDREAVDEAVRSAQARGAAHQMPGSYRIEHRVPTPRGGVRWLEARGSVQVDPAGAPVRMQGTAVDCTQRKAAEEALRAREETFRLYTELASDYVYVADLPDLSPTIVAGAFERTTGMTSEEVGQRGGWPAVIHPDDRPAVERVMASVAKGEPVVVEYRITTSDGDERWLRDRVRPVMDPETNAPVRLYGAVRDITERKRLEGQLVEAQKEEALARFSAGVAHDFNNLLTVILGSTDLLAEESTTALGRESLDAIRDATRQAAELTRGLLLFARRNAGSPRTLTVSELFERATPILRQGLGKQHRLDVTVPKTPLHIRIDES